MISSTASAGFWDSFYISYPRLANEISIVNPTPAPLPEPREYLWQVVGYDHEFFDLADRIIIAESGWKPDIKNASSSASGLFQFLDSTFEHYCIEYYQFAVDMNQKNNPYIQIDCAIHMIADGGLRHWSESEHLWDR